MGNILSNLSKKKISVYAIPDNVIEIALTKNSVKRQTMSIALNTLIEGQRMEYSWENNSMLLLCEYLSKHWNNSISTHIIEKKSKESSLSYLGLLAQMGLLQNYKLGNFNTVLRSKFETKYIQTLFLKNFEKYQNALISQINNQFNEEIKKEIEEIQKVDLDILREKIQENLENVKRNKNLSKLEKNKDKLIKLYTFKNTYELFEKYLSNICEMLETINFDLIVNEWKKKNPFDIKRPEVIKPLPNTITSLEQYKINDYFQIIKFIIDRYNNLGLLPITNLMMHIYFNELTRTIRSPKKISAGLSIDLNYFSIFLKADYFLTYDDKLATTLKPILILL